MEGEKIGPGSFLLVSERPRGRPISRKAAWWRWYSPLAKSGLNEKGRTWHSLHFHVLRKYFKFWSSLSGANSDTVEFTMGHRSSTPQKYFGGSTTSPPEGIAALEKEYRKAVSALEVLSEEQKVRELETKLEKQAKELRAPTTDKETFAGALRELPAVKKDLERQQAMTREMGLKLAELEAKARK
jgi:hypothetical protein